MTRDEPLEPLREELWLVQRQLGRLAAERRSHFLSLSQEESYHILAARELALIAELAGAIDSVVDVDLTDGTTSADDNTDSTAARFHR
jgi:hypothetical protein